MKAGIVDPTKVVRTALQNAASVAGLLLTTEAIVAEKPEREGFGGAGDASGRNDVTLTVQRTQLQRRGAKASRLFSLRRRSAFYNRPG